MPTVGTSSGTPAPARGTTVLHVGDSFVRSGLAQALQARLSPLGVRYAVHAQQSTNSLDWSKRIGPLVQQYAPDLVIVTLGGNEIASKHVAVQARAVERIVAAIGRRPCVWTTPPLWREEEGLFDAIRTHLKPCRYFETDLVVGRPIARRADGIHPTPEGGESWAAALWEWLGHERRGTDASWALRDAPAEEYLAQGRRKPLSVALEPVARHP
jgi:lysophospholipase L1-like esterase